MGADVPPSQQDNMMANEKKSVTFMDKPVEPVELFDPILFM